MDDLSAEIAEIIKKSITGEIKTDPISRVLYSTDASIHQIKPLGVVFPKDIDDLNAIMSISNEYNVPLVPRGSGSSLAGQAIGNGLIIDCSRYLNKSISINPEEMTAVVDPGVVLDDLNRAAKSYSLQFGPDPASSERATIGGCIGNNAAGAHSIIFGMTADHILGAEVVLADGTVTTFQQVSLEKARKLAAEATGNNGSDIEKNIYRAALSIREDYREEIRNSWPKTWRRVSGYNLNYLLPWTPTAPPQWNYQQLPYPPVLLDTINLAQLLVGSEGTLAILRNTTLRLVSLPKHTLLVVIVFTSINQACDIVPEILRLSPSAIELIPQSLIHLARSVPAYANQFSFLNGEPGAILVVEFSGNDARSLSEKAASLEKIRSWESPVIIAENASQQKQIWAVRKVGLGILMSRPGEKKPISFIEDMAVPVERLGEFVRELERILDQHGTQGDFYGHASAGCLHVRPLLNIRTTSGRANLRTIAEAAAKLALDLGGAISAEHGDGITRSEWIERAYGPRIVEALRLLKRSADPHNNLNPGKIVDPPKMDTSLRYDESYHPQGWTPVMSFASSKPEATSLIEAIEQCNGAAVCLKSTGVMCPSFQATRDDLFSTRGRANLLRAMVSSGFSSQHFATQAVRETLDKCLACKGCKAECPSAVDMAKLKYEFYRYYYSLRGNSRPLRDYLFAYIAQVSRLGRPFSPLVNFFLSSSQFGGIRKGLLGLSKNRTLPRLSAINLRKQAKRLTPYKADPDCLLLMDAFNEYYYPQVALAALKVLRQAGSRVRVLATIGAGRTLISKGFLEQTKRHNQSLVHELKAIDPKGRMPVIGLEPSEIYTLRDEFMDLFPADEYVEALADRAYMIDEFLLRPGLDGSPRVKGLENYFQNKNRTNVLIHGHCYQKAQPPAKDGLPYGVGATAALLDKAGYNVSVIEDGCCGMAGAFGYEVEHYELSVQVGELALMPAVRNSPDSIITAAGISCQAQIQDGTGRLAVHPISLVAARCGL
jgi:FAD/FMN-containing dehydrogenase/Fe-S oxidoreductase